MWPETPALRLGLRGRVMLTFTLGAALVSVLLAVSVFTISRGYLLDQRERSADRLASADADVVRARLAEPGTSPQDALAAVDPPTGTRLLLFSRGSWYTANGVTEDDLPPDDLRDSVADGERAIAPLTVRDVPYFVVGIPLDDGAFYEFTPVIELRSTIQILGTVLVICAIAATVAAALVGRWASRRVLQPLRPISQTAASIAGGSLDTRLPGADDRDLDVIVSSFNSMVDSLQQRIERERRFVGDVTHELRTPLTTLVTSVEVMRNHADELPDRPRQALDLIVSELDHLRGMLDDLLTLARTEAGLHHDEEEPLDLHDLLTHVLTGRPAVALDAEPGVYVRGRKLALVRAFTNLIDNADRHGGGLTRVSVTHDADAVTVHLDDRGQGVPATDRAQIFERFSTGHTARGAASGTGLGLALVAETMAVHHGAVECADAPGGGARFTVTLPLAASPEDDEQAL
ncbi:sensor histidine kinase [Actinokineospora xionganensis]|uniref:histidine kinase n=1 Tax=Actinokineospora xionganensis TaxID=2684470 RepID=A0ABR7L069_9PSEU|nr:HAMP domain-containing sensor histidine kinase [Actinokineospora xionganensis]MBC6445992.1 HAMP domain-containing histidine kinase [Actinokineospora xionganensis]